MPRDIASSKSEVHLRSRRVSPSRGAGKGLLRRAESRREQGARTVHALVATAEPLDGSARAALRKEHGVRLLDPVPDGAFLAALPADAEALRALTAKDGPLRWAVPLEPADKLSETLAAGDVPGHARVEGGVRVVVMFFGDVSARAQQGVLKRVGARGAERVEPVNGWVVEVALDDLARLVGEDEVKWVEEVPPPIEVDNDGVRAANGLNADVALAAPYGLTGAGVTIAHWEDTHASHTHPDFAGRFVVADGPLVAGERTLMHTENGAPNGTFEVGEAIYVDMDDSATVTAGDVRVTAVGAFAAGSTVNPGDADVGTALVLFAANELYDDTNGNGYYTPGDGLYRDVDNTRRVSAGDVRLVPVGAFAAGSVVAAGNADVGRQLYSPTDPHYHSTHCAGTAVGSGAASAANGGGPNQWRGVAPGAVLRSYSTAIGINADYVDAAANGTTISTNSWGSTHMHQVASAAASYDATTALYDAVVSGRRSDGTPSGLAAPVLVVASAGNAGRPERHTENVAANGAYDNGESIYVDADDSGTVTAGSFETLLSGPAQAIGTPLVAFAENEKHDDVSGAGSYSSGEGIYRDVDGSGTVSAGDVRLTAVGAFAAGSVVAAGNPDVGRLLRGFRMWRTVRVPNSAKDTVEVASIGSDNSRPAASSSRGPTLDGRIKPDVAGPGTQFSGDFAITSTQPRGLYGGITGTSMSTPAVAGGLALVTEWYRQLCGGTTPAPHTLRALLAHAAEDRVTIPNVGTAFSGPDYTHGFGRARVKEMLDLVPHHRVGSAAVLGDTDYTFTIGAVAGLKVTLAWDDPAWTSNAAPSPATGFLQNDLDLVVVAPDGTQHTPWVLDPANPSQPATRGAFVAAAPIPASARDRRNTIEQVVVDNAAAGTWTIKVQAAMLNLGPQPYTIVCEFIPPQDSPCSAAPAGDVWMKDNAADTGAEPSSGTLWLSPDLWNRVTAPDAVEAHENPEHGQTNWLYAKVRNRGGSTVRAVSVDVWVAPASTGLVWPGSFTYVGRFPVANLAPGERLIGPLPWRPPSPSPSSHFCCYVRVTSPQDPITVAETASVATNASTSNNIAWRNLNIVDAAPNMDASFLVEQTEDVDAEVEIVLTAPPELVDPGRLGLRLPPVLEELVARAPNRVKGLREPAPEEVARYQRLRASAARDAEVSRVAAPLRRLAARQVRLPAMKLGRGEAHALTLSFAPGKVPAGKQYEVDVVQRVNGEVVGGIRYVLRGTARPRKPRS